MSDIQRFVFRNKTCSLFSLFQNEIQIHHNSLKYYCICTTLISIVWKTLNLQLFTLLLVFVPQVAVPTFPSQNLQKLNLKKYIFVNIIVLRKLWSNNHRPLLYLQQTIITQFLLVYLVSEHVCQPRLLLCGQHKHHYLQTQETGYILNTLAVSNQIHQGKTHIYAWFLKQKKYSPHVSTYATFLICYFVC